MYGHGSAKRATRLASAASAALLATMTWSWAGDQPMDSTVELKVMQSGFGGLSGTHYHIEPNGSYVARSIIAGETGEIVGQGSLDSATMIELSHRLRSTDLDAVPERGVAFTGVNPTIIEISYGQVTRSLVLPPGQQVEPGCPGGLEESFCRVLDISEAVERAVKPQQ